MGTFYSVRGKLVGKAEPCAGVKADATALAASLLLEMNETRTANRQPVDPFDALTERERQILEGLAGGLKRFCRRKSRSISRPGHKAGNFPICVNDPKRTKGV